MSTAFSFAPTRRRRRISLTPMIDVVFLLLIFFMLVSRFGVERALPIVLPGPAPATTAYDGPPRLVAIGADTLRLNGAPTSLSTLPDALRALMQAPDDLIVLRAEDGADLQMLVTVMEALSRAGLSRLVVVE
tara:strand:- start:631 stop:1026 length:396 start_codon:yes stop_codon:yes gene_type:complete